MSEQQYREALQEIRSIGAKSGTDLNAINRIFDVVDRALRIERPVPNTDKPWDRIDVLTREWRQAVITDDEYSNAVMALLPSPHPPTREQIAEAFQKVAEAYAPGRTWDTEVMYDDPTWDAMVEFRALIQNGANRG